MDTFKKSDINPLEIWGGAEYSYVRVGNAIYDQLDKNGHEKRPGDFQLFSELGIKTIRYPLLWEKFVDDPTKFFKLHDQRLNSLQKLDITPIAGLLHHGSGPFFTDLSDQDFPALLADFAYTISKRYPWIDLYTPVNEPLTTARFSGLYGIWYPHRKDDNSFAVMLLNQIKGMMLSMEAVRSINPDSKLIPTEDICKVYGTAEMQYQVDFENERRWLTYDLLLGRVDSSHPLWQYFLNSGIRDKELEYFLSYPVTPYINGFNYYVTSERYLDKRKSIYPQHYYGGNGRQSYVDVEAVRANMSEETGVKKLLREAWLRYRLPVALTEVHIGCTREEQLRWFHEAYTSAISLREEGVDMKAVTAWSLFGSFDWDSLLCVKNNNYEPGVFDIRSVNPRPTALAGMIRSINSGNHLTSPLLEVPGWWRRNDRILYKDPDEQTVIVKNNESRLSEVSPLLIVGANGSLGKVLGRVCKIRGIVYCLSDRKQLDIASAESVKNFLALKKPWAVINAAGFARIDAAEQYSQVCFRENTTGPAIMAEVCRDLGIKFVTFSSDQVFNGEKRVPYDEQDLTHPLNMYGLSKRLAEEQVLAINSESLVIRSSLFFNPWNEDDNLLRILNDGNTSDQKHFLASDIIISPAYAPDLANAVLDLLIDGEKGIKHLSNQEEISYYDFVRKALHMAGLNEKIISSVHASELNYTAVRPLYSVLQSSYGIILPILSQALECFLNEFNQGFQLINQPSL